MSETVGSITRLVSQLRYRDELAIETIWGRYVRRIHSAARSVIAGLAPGAGDEEDVAQSAFHAFCEAVAADRLPPIGSRHELWRLLLMFTRRRAIDCVRREFRARRGGGTAAANNAEVMNRAIDGGCSPIQLAELQEAFENLLQQLAATGDERLEEIARLRLEGLSNLEIADQLGCAVRTIQRKLHILERLWTEHR